MNWIRRVGVVVGALVLSAGTAFPVAQQIGVPDTALLFGGIDAQGGIGDWYVSNGVVEAIVDNVAFRPTSRRSSAAATSRRSRR